MPIKGLIGAPAPFIIHSDKSTLNEDKSEKIYLNPKYSAGLGEAFSAIEEKNENKRNPYGFSVRTTQNGSMTQGTMKAFVQHFVRHLPPSQGKGKEPLFLFLEGHVSRWETNSLLYLIQNNVFPFFLASHTSVWAQPNDNGPNLRLHKCVEEAVSKLGLRYSGKKTKQSYFNIIIRHGWREFLVQERQDIITCGSNSATGAYRHCGLGPFNPYCTGWNHVLSTLGILNKKLKEAENGE